MGRESSKSAGTKFGCLYMSALFFCALPLAVTVSAHDYLRGCFLSLGRLVQ